MKYIFPSTLEDFNGKHRHLIKTMIQIELCSRSDALRWALDLIMMPDREKLVGIMKTARDIQKELLILSACKEILETPTLNTLQEIKDWACEKEMQFNDPDIESATQYLLMLIYILEI